MKFNKTMLGVGALTLLLTAGAVAGASAYQGDYSQKGQIILQNVMNQ